MRLTVRASRLLWFAHWLFTIYLWVWHGEMAALLWVGAWMVGGIAELLHAREEKNVARGDREKKPGWPA